MRAMRTALLTMLLAVAVAAVGIAAVTPEASPARAGVPPTIASTLVSSVLLEGASLPLQTARAAMQTGRGSTINAATLASDEHALANLLVEGGYFAATVDPAIVEYGPSGAHVRFMLHPGVVYRVATITVDGISSARGDGLATDLTMSVGDFVTDSSLAHNRALLAELLDRRQLRHGDITSVVVRDDVTHTLAVTFVVGR